MTNNVKKKLIYGVNVCLMLILIFVSVPTGQALESADFELVVAPSLTTVNVGEDAIYNLTLTNTGSVEDTYDLVADRPSNTTVTLANNVTIGQGNSAVVELIVVSSIAGNYTVNVTATSRADENNSKTVETVTNVVIPILTIENFKSVPNSAISNTNPAQISLDVKKGIYNITKVEFGIVDSNNLSGKGVGTILMFHRNFSGEPGLYGPKQWNGNYVGIGNVAVSDIVTIYDASDVQGYNLVRGTFKANSTSNDTEALLWFNATTGNLSNVTKPFDGGFSVLNIQEGNSTFRAKISKFINGVITQEYSSGNIFKLYNVTGNFSMDNPHVVTNVAWNGNYKVYAMANDTNGSVYQLIDVDTIPASTGGGRGGSGGSDGGTYPTVTATPRQNITAVPTTVETPGPTVTVVATVKQTGVQPVKTAAAEPTETKGSPGVGIIATIGIIGTIYIIRRKK